MFCLRYTWVECVSLCEVYFSKIPHPQQTGYQIDLDCSPRHNQLHCPSAAAKTARISHARVGEMGCGVSQSNLQCNIPWVWHVLRILHGLPGRLLVSQVRRICRQRWHVLRKLPAKIAGKGWTVVCLSLPANSKSIFAKMVQVFFFANIFYGCLSLTYTFQRIGRISWHSTVHLSRRIFSHGIPTILSATTISYLKNDLDTTETTNRPPQLNVIVELRGVGNVRVGYYLTICSTLLTAYACTHKWNVIQSVYSFRFYLFFILFFCILRMLCIILLFLYFCFLFSFFFSCFSFHFFLHEWNRFEHIRNAAKRWKFSSPILVMYIRSRVSTVHSCVISGVCMRQHSLMSDICIWHVVDYVVLTICNFVDIRWFYIRTIDVCV